MCICLYDVCVCFFSSTNCEYCIISGLSHMCSVSFWIRDVYISKCGYIVLTSKICEVYFGCVCIYIAIEKMWRWCVWCVYFGVLCMHITFADAKKCEAWQLSENSIMLIFILYIFFQFHSHIYILTASANITANEHVFFYVRICNKKISKWDNKNRFSFVWMHIFDYDDRNSSLSYCCYYLTCWSWVRYASIEIEIIYI